MLNTKKIPGEQFQVLLSKLYDLTDSSRKRYSQMLLKDYKSTFSDDQIEELLQYTEYEKTDIHPPAFVMTSLGTDKEKTDDLINELKDVSISDLLTAAFSCYFRGAKYHIPKEPTVYTFGNLPEELRKRPEMLIPGVLAPGLSLLVSLPKVGKSWTAANIVYSLQTGRPLFGVGDYTPREKMSCAVLSPDAPACDVWEKIEMLKNKYGDDEALKNIAISDAATGVSRIGDGFEEQIERLANAGYNYIIVDTLQDIVPTGGGNRNAYAIDNVYMNVLRELSTKFNVGFLLIHHYNKATGGDVYMRASGSTAITGKCDMLLALYRDKKDELDIILEPGGRYCPHNAEKLTLRAGDMGMLSFIGYTEEMTRKREEDNFTSSEIYTAVCNALEDNGGRIDMRLNELRNYGIVESVLTLSGHIERSKKLFEANGIIVSVKRKKHANAVYVGAYKKTL